jgi:hypothetical protein
VPYIKASPSKILENDKVEYEADTPKGKVKIISSIKDTF